MTREERQSLQDAIRQERDRLLAEGSTTVDELQEVVEEKHAGLVARWSSSLARQRLRDLCQESLIATVGPEEMLLLPGFGEDRRTYTVREGRIYRYFPVERAKLRHVDADLEVSAKNQRAVNREHRNRVQRRDLLWTAPGAHPDMLVVDALRLVYSMAPGAQTTHGDAA